MNAAPITQPTIPPITAPPLDAAVLDAIAWTLVVSPDWSADALTVIADLTALSARIPASWTQTHQTDRSTRR